MAGFKKAKAEQAALKVGLYGPSGSGKTFTTLLFAEGLAKLTGKRIAFVDTEHGTDFYCKAVPERTPHPEGFDFDALYTRSLTETLADVRTLDEKQYGVLIIDSMTHIWEACKAAYSGKTNAAGQIPFHAWGKIKKPYKDLIAFLLSTPMHVFICGRQGNEYGESETGELAMIGVKMKAEGETPYEPHILLRMEAVRPKPTANPIITAFPEKDRTGRLFAGGKIQWPTYENTIAPLMGLLGDTQATVKTEDEVAMQDAEAVAMDEGEKAEHSATVFRKFKARMDACDTKAELKKVANDLTPDIKKTMLSSDVVALREHWSELEAKLP